MKIINKKDGHNNDDARKSEKVNKRTNDADSVKKVIK